MLSLCPLTWRCSSWHPHCWPLSSFGGGMGLVPAVWHGKGAVLGGWQYHHLAQCSPAGRPQHIILLGERHYWEGLSWCCPTRSVSGNVTISTKGHEEETPEDIHFHWLLGSSQWLTVWLEQWQKKTCLRCLLFGKKYPTHTCQLWSSVSLHTYANKYQKHMVTLQTAYSNYMPVPRPHLWVLNKTTRQRHHTH